MHRAWLLVSALLLAGCTTTSFETTSEEVVQSLPPAEYDGPAFRVPAPAWSAGDWWAFDVDGATVRLTVLTTGLETERGVAAVLGASQGPFDPQDPQAASIAVTLSDMGMPGAWKQGLGDPDPACLGPCSPDADGHRVEARSQLPVVGHHAIAFFPLEGGKRLETGIKAETSACGGLWTLLHVSEVCDTRHTESILRSTVVGVEQVSVPAGTFEAVRIEVLRKELVDEEGGTAAEPTVIHYAADVQQVVSIRLADWATPGTYWLEGRHVRLTDHGRGDGGLDLDAVSRWNNERHVDRMTRERTLPVTVEAPEVVLTGGLGGPDGPATLGATTSAGEVGGPYDALAAVVLDPDGLSVAKARDHARYRSVDAVGQAHLPGAYTAIASSDYFGRAYEEATAPLLVHYEAAGNAACPVPAVPVVMPDPCDSITFPVAPGELTVSAGTAIDPTLLGRIVLLDQEGAQVAAQDAVPGSDTSVTVQVPAVPYGTVWSAAFEPGASVDMQVPYDVRLTVTVPVA